MRDEWLVLDLCGYGHRALDGVVRRTNRESHIRRLEVDRRRPRSCMVASKGRRLSSTVRVLTRTMSRTTSPGSDENHVSDDELQTQELQSVGRQRGASCL